MLTDFKKEWLNLTLGNDFMFGKVFQDTSLCRELIQLILPELDIERVEFPERQKALAEGIFMHGVRFDVYTRTDKGEIIDVEIQTADTGNLPKRIRAYHSMITRSEMDIRKMKNYNDIHKAYVIFICLFDLFGKGRHIYTFRNICMEDTSIELNDGASTIFLNAKGVADDVSPRMKAFLNLTMGIKSDDSFVKRLEAKMEEVLMTPEMEWEYWAQRTRAQDYFDRGKNEGLSLGRLEIAGRMRNAGFTDEQICSLTGLSPEDLSRI
ncbi:MAG: Rpn family recombination-promoting nuclease/putative transposase [Synergistaceae bacterium]|nr:Rpn family recombination-promoting nuclease/putative transposase [Synergistaceae bacterium]